MTFSNRWWKILTAAGVLAAASALIVGCSAGGSPGTEQTGVQSSSSQRSSTPSTGNTVPAEKGKDGRTLQPGKTSGSCEAFSPAEVRAALGRWAVNLQESQGEVSVDRDGTTVDTCVYPLELNGGVDHSLIVERKDFISADRLRAADPLGMLMTQEPVDGLKGTSRFGVNTLSGSTEYVVVSFSESRLSRLLLSEPNIGQPMDPAEAKKILTGLAIQAGF